MNWWIDSLEIWVIKLPDWKIVPWIWLSKKLFKKNITENTEIHSNTWVNTAWFFINLWAKYTNTEELKNIFEEKKEWWSLKNFAIWTNINYINIWWPLNITTVWLNVSEMNEESFAWVEKMVEKMWPMMDKILNECKRWTPVSQISSHDENILWLDNWEELTEKQANIFKEKYSEIFETYQILTKWLDDNQKKQIISKLKRSAISQYSNKIHKNSEWFNFTWVWAWIALISWFLPVPYVMANWEYNYSNVKETKDCFADKVSESIKISQGNKENLKPVWNELWMDLTSYKWNNVLKIWKNSQWVNILADKDSKIQVERNENWEIFISSWAKKWLKIKILKTINNEKKSYTIIFWDHEQANIKNISDTITSSLTLKKISIPWKTIKMSDEISEWNNNENLKKSVIAFSNKMNKWDEKNIYNITEEFRKNLKISKTDEKFSQNINSSYEKFLNSLDKNWSLKKFSNLKKSLPKNPYLSEKTIILESLLSNVMKDRNLKWKSLWDWETAPDLEQLKTWVSKKILNLKNTDWLEKWQKIYNWISTKTPQWHKDMKFLYLKMPIQIYDTIKQRKPARSDVFSDELNKSIWINKNSINTANEKFYSLNNDVKKPNFKISRYTKWDMIAFPAPWKFWMVPRTWVIEYANMEWKNDFIPVNPDWNKKNKNWSLKAKTEITMPKEMVNKLPQETLDKLLKKWIESWKIDKNNQNINYIKQILSWAIKKPQIEFKHEKVFFKWWKCFNSSIWVKFEWLEATSAKEIWWSIWDISGYINWKAYWVVNKSIILTWAYTEKAKDDKEKDEPIKEKKPEEIKKDETTEPDIAKENETTFIEESKIVNENPNKWETIWESINNWVTQEPEITTKTTITQEIIDDAVWNTIIEKPVTINPNINTWVEVWDVIELWTDNPLSNIKSTETVIVNEQSVTNISETEATTSPNTLNWETQIEIDSSATKTSDWDYSSKSDF